MTPRPTAPVKTLSALGMLLGIVALGGCGDSPRPVTQRVVNPADEWVYSIDTGVGGRPETTRPFSDPLRSVYYGEPLSNPLQPLPTVLYNTGYVVGYDVPAKTPLWTCYRLFASSANPATNAAKSAYVADARVPVGEAAEPAKGKKVDDYGSKGYQRRLLAPTAFIGSDYGDAAAQETLLSSNVVPVRAGRGDVWDQITALEWPYAQAYDELWVIAGPLFSGEVTALPSGSAVPDGFWKIHVTVHKGRSRIQAFIVPQPTGEKGGKAADLADYLVSVGSIEEKTGLSFFPDCHDIDGDTAELRRVVVPQGVWSTERDTAAR
jgi:DNA/RNA endonuclease G (NUC1)